MTSAVTASKRISSIDMLKGLGILLLILSHSIPGDSNLKTWIFSFHMPLFFVCTGYLTFRRYPSPNKLKGKIWTILKHKAKSILIPYFIFSIIYLLFLAGLEFIASKEIPFDFLTDGLFSIFSLSGYASMWFLPCLFLSECLFLLLYRFSGYAGLFVGCLCSFYLNYRFNGAEITGLIGMLLKSTTGFIFMITGCLLFALSSHVRWMKTGSKNHITILVIILSLLCGAVLSLANGFVSIGTFTYGNMAVYYFSASLTIFGFFLLFQKTKEIPLISYFGKNSIVILCTNNLVIECVRLVDYKLTGDFFVTHGMLGDFLFALLVTLLEFFIIQFVLRFCPKLFGINR